MGTTAMLMVRKLNYLMSPGSPLRVYSKHIDSAANSKVGLKNTFLKNIISSFMTATAPDSKITSERIDLKYANPDGTNTNHFSILKH